MTWLDKLERRLGFLAIPGLLRILVGFTALVFVLIWLNPDFRFLLDLDPARIRHGEVWRLITYIFLPQTLSPLWIILALWFLWSVGEGLEQALGPFRVTVYFFLGMIGTTVAAFFFGSNFSNAMLLSSLFFAYARFYPEQVIYILFILPAKIKWVAWVLALFLIVGFLTNTNSYRAALVAAFANYFIFFGPDLWREMRHRRGVATRRQRFETESRDATAEALHRCATCGATELTDPQLEFRVARNGEEYCMPHLPRAQTAAPA
jgi:membrane associated rhomboid family serine protease